MEMRGSFLSSLPTKQLHRGSLDTTQHTLILVQLRMIVFLDSEEQSSANYPLLRLHFPIATRLLTRIDLQSSSSFSWQTWLSLEPR